VLRLWSLTVNFLGVLHRTVQHQHGGFHIKKKKKPPTNEYLMGSWPDRGPATSGCRDCELSICQSNSTC
jgi:hypothetical protein